MSTWVVSTFHSQLYMCSYTLSPSKRKIVTKDTSPECHVSYKSKLVPPPLVFITSGPLLWVIAIYIDLISIILNFDLMCYWTKEKFKKSELQYMTVCCKLIFWIVVKVRTVRKRYVYLKIKKYNFILIDVALSNSHVAKRKFQISLTSVGSTALKSESCI